jgi:hypothetical protein
MSIIEKEALQRLKAANEQGFKTRRRKRIDEGFGPEMVGLTLSQFASLSPIKRLALFNAWLAAKLAGREPSNV